MRLRNTISNELYENVTTISTCESPDEPTPYETAIDSSFYSDQWIVVERYKTAKLAKIGHNKWCRIMKVPPSEIKRVSAWNGLIESKIYKRKDLE